jgi:hypothetical protein
MDPINSFDARAAVDEQAAVVVYSALYVAKGFSMATDTGVGRAALGATQRTDAWWAGPLATALGLGAFVVYATIRGLYNADYHLGIGTDMLPEHAYLLSPMYSPLLAFPGMPSWLSPAVLILWMPGGFRVTCYYYRKAYYRAFFLDPPACGPTDSA